MLARVLTGEGVNLRGTPPPRLPPARAGLYRSEGLFEFNPARTTFGAKTLLGQRIDPAGFDEVARAVSILAREPATARFISVKLAAYFIADNPPPALVERMAQTFTRTDGDIAAVLRTLFLRRNWTGNWPRPRASSRIRWSMWCRRCGSPMKAVPWPTCAR